MKQKIAIAAFIVALLTVVSAISFADGPPTRSRVAAPQDRAFPISAPNNGWFYGGVAGSYDWEAEELSSFAAGAFLGYQLRSGNFGLGLEGDALRRFENLPEAEEIDQWTFTVRGRAGLYITPDKSSPFVYGTVGVAFQAGEEDLAWGGGLEVSTSEKGFLRAELLRIENSLETTTLRLAFGLKF